MKKKIILLCTTIVAIVLEALPYGAVLKFGNPNGKPWRRTFSYFDITTFGYANFAPFIVAFLTCTLLILIIVSIFMKKSLRIPIIAVSAIATILSLAPLLIGVDYFTIVAAFIFIVLMITTRVAFVKE